MKCNAIYSGKNNFGSGCSAYSKIKDKKLKEMAIFGVNYNSATPNVNRADVVLQCDPKLVLVGKAYKLEASHVHYLGDLPKGGFDPVIAIIYKGDRSQFGLKGARVSIYPSGGRTFKSEIK